MPPVPQRMKGQRAVKVSAEPEPQVVEDANLHRRNEVRVVATVEAEGLLPEERLPQGWRAIFCAP